MALINCPECGNQISDKVIACPNCGCPSSEFNKTEEIKLVCPDCGQEIIDSNTPCPNCGCPSTLFSEVRRPSMGLFPNDTIGIKKNTDTEEHNNSIPLLSIFFIVSFLGIFGFIYYANNDNSDTYDSYSHEEELTPTQSNSVSKDISWIYGSWSCTTPYGTMNIRIERNGKMWDSEEGTYYSYTIEGDVLVEHCRGYGTTFPLNFATKTIGTGEPGYVFHKNY